MAENTNSSENNPKPKRRQKKSVNKRTDKVELTNLDLLHIDQLYKQIENRYKDSILLDKRVKYKEMNHLASIAEEYLSCSLIIGYSMEGEKVCILNAQNSKDEAAVADLLRSTFLDMTSNRP